MSLKTVYEKETKDELISRINSLNPESKAQWGKMNVYQMAKHCRMWEEMLAGKIKVKRKFISFLFGPLILKAVLKDNRGMRPNSPTVPEFVIKENSGDLEKEKQNWIEALKNQVSLSNELIHPFFGKMTSQQIGQLAYKHNDHHLRQFGA